MNKVILVGRLGRDTEMFYTQDGKPIAKLNVATSEYYNKETHTEWHNCVAFAKTAEYCNKYLAKGDLVSIIGKLHTRNYVDKNGKTCYITEVIVNEVNRLTARRGSDANENFDDDAPF